MTPLELQVQQLMAQVDRLQSQINYLEKSDRYTIQKLIQMNDGRNFQFGLSTGTKIGTSATQKMSFYNATPIVKPTGVAVSAAGIHAALTSLGLLS